MDPLVSIVMGAYNEANTILTCVESIINQTYKNWELIVCDDCSTDKTFEVLTQIAKQDNRIRILRNSKNMKLAYSLNRCLNIANGEYIARIDADDECTTDRIEKQVQYMDAHPEIATVGTGVYLYDGNRVVGTRFFPENPSEFILKKTVPFAHPTILMRKVAYETLGGYSVDNTTNRGQDLDLWFRFFEKGLRGYNIQEPLLYYHETEKDYEKRNFKAAMCYSRIMYHGFKRLKWPFFYYIYILRPLLIALIPSKFRYKLKHRIKNHIVR